jgi:uncharacterized membrane protein YtjA (UPF0391 family)
VRRAPENELLSVPAAALRGEVKARSAFTPWLQEGTLAGAGAVLIGVSGVATTTTELATILFTLSLVGLAVLLAADARAKRRWTVR